MLRGAAPADAPRGSSLQAVSVSSYPSAGPAAEMTDMHHHYAEPEGTDERSPGPGPGPGGADHHHHHHPRDEDDDNSNGNRNGNASDYDLRGPTMTFDLSEVSTAYEPAYEPDLETSSLRPKNQGLAVSLSASHQQHKRQQSAPVFSLPRINSRPLSLSPTRWTPDHHHHHHHTEQPSQDMPLTGDGRSGGSRSPNTPGRFANWFGGASTTATIADGRGSPNTSTTPSLETTPRSNAAQQPRFGFFSSLTTRLANTAQPVVDPQQLDDELCNLDIETALYPGTGTGTPLSSPTTPERDAFSPAAYKNLQTNAAGLLLKMQGAYRARVAALREAEAERAAQREEVEETQLRVELFRTQLEDMAAKAAEHEKAMQRLAAELDAERLARREERERMMAVVAAAQQQQQEKEGAGPASSGSLSICSPSEDLGVDDDADDDEEQRRRKRWRGSRGTVKSDLSVETMTTDGESSSSSSSSSSSARESVESASVFSRRRSRSPTVMTSITTAETENAGSGEVLVVAPSPSQKLSVSAAAALAPPKPKPVQQLSTFQKFVKGISGSQEAESSRGGPENCRNCRGQDSSVAWDTVSLLRDENKGLKHRVAQLEVAVEGALDAVNGIGL